MTLQELLARAGPPTFSNVDSGRLGAFPSSPQNPLGGTFGQQPPPPQPSAQLPWWAQPQGNAYRPPAWASAATPPFNPTQGVNPLAGQVGHYGQNLAAALASRGQTPAPAQQASPALMAALQRLTSLLPGRQQQPLFF